MGVFEPAAKQQLEREVDRLRMETEAVEDASNAGAVDDETASALVEDIVQRAGTIEERIREVERRSVQARVPVDERGKLQQLPLVAKIQRFGDRGVATVVASEFLGETDEKRSFYLEIVVDGERGLQFDAGMRLHIRRTSPQRVQDFSLEGAKFAVRYDPSMVKHVALDPSEIPN